VNPLRLIVLAVLALFVAAPAAHAKDFRVGPARAVVKQVKASADGRLTPVPPEPAAPARRAWWSSAAAGSFCALG